MKEEEEGGGDLRGDEYAHRSPINRVRTSDILYPCSALAEVKSDLRKLVNLALDKNIQSERIRLLYDII